MKTLGKFQLIKEMITQLVICWIILILKRIIKLLQ